MCQATEHERADTNAASALIRQAADNQARRHSVESAGRQHDQHSMINDGVDVGAAVRPEEEEDDEKVGVCEEGRATCEADEVEHERREQSNEHA